MMMPKDPEMVIHAGLTFVHAGFLKKNLSSVKIEIPGSKRVLVEKTSRQFLVETSSSRRPQTRRSIALVELG